MGFLVLSRAGSYNSDVSFVGYKSVYRVVVVVWWVEGVGWGFVVDGSSLRLGLVLEVGLELFFESVFS